MICQPHRKQISFLCRSENCNYLPLCKECCKAHSSTHPNQQGQMLPFSKAIMLAQENLKKQKIIIQEHIRPYSEKNQMLGTIEEQKQKLLRQKERIIKLVSQQIDEEISRLIEENRGSGYNQTQFQTVDQFRKKLAEIQELTNLFRRKPSILRKSINYEIESFLQELGRRNANLTSMKSKHMTSFKLYDTTRHDFVLSKIELKEKNLQGKILKKIMNQSPLYFLIDERYSTSPLLYYFNDKTLRIYNIQDESWKAVENSDIPTQGTTAHNYLQQKFYYFGGVAGSRKTDSIMCFNSSQFKWQKYRMEQKRSSAMSTFYKDKRTKKGKVMVMGGIGQNNQILKSCEIFDCETGQCKQVGDSNFATCNGTLVNYNDQFLLKIGGLSKARGDYSIVEIIEKFDLNSASSKWSYIELEDIRKGQLQQSHQFFFANQGAIQINPNQIFVFGGFGSDQKGTSNSYIIEIQKFKVFSRSTKEQMESYRYYARWYNEKPLISGDDFKELKPIIWGKKLFSLQNISGNRQKSILQKEKRLIQFNMYEWYQTENIVSE